LGILNQPWQTFFEARSNNHFSMHRFHPEAIDALVAERTLRAMKKTGSGPMKSGINWKKPGIILEDKTDGTHWKVAT
jgi:cysteinyl-tRNA synthetase